MYLEQLSTCSSIQKDCTCTYMWACVHTQTGSCGRIVRFVSVLVIKIFILNPAGCNPTPVHIQIREKKICTYALRNLRDVRCVQKNPYPEADSDRCIKGFTLKGSTWDGYFCWLDFVYRN